MTKLTAFQRKLARMRKTWAQVMAPNPVATQPTVTYSIFTKLDSIYDDLTDEQKELLDEARSKVKAGGVLNLNDHDALRAMLAEAY